jgi:hypothetical protein
MDVKHKSSISLLHMQGLNVQDCKVHHASSESVLKYRLTVFKLTRLVSLFQCGEGNFTITSETGESLAIMF